MTTLLPVALLAGLVVVQTVVGDEGALLIDARLAAVAVAVVLLLLRANFIVVVFAAALVGAGLRLPRLGLRIPSPSSLTTPSRCSPGCSCSKS